MKFTLNRNHVLATTSGHSIEFVKDQPTHVPPHLYREVQAIGALPEEDLPEEPVSEDAAPTDPQERAKAIQDAMVEIVERGVREDFTATGAPHTRALSRILGWNVSSQERDIQWAEVNKPAA